MQLSDRRLRPWVALVLALVFAGCSSGSDSGPAASDSGGDTAGPAADTAGCLPPTGPCDATGVDTDEAPGGGDDEGPGEDPEAGPVDGSGDDAGGPVPDVEDDSPDGDAGGVPDATASSTLAGKVTGANGVPLLDALVEVATGGSDLTDTGGNYAIGGLPAGTFTATCSKDGYEPQTASVTLLAGETTTRDFVLSQLPAASGCFDDDFEGKLGWQLTGLWHSVSKPEDIENAYGCPGCGEVVELVGDWKLPACHSGDWCLWYGIDATGSYCKDPFELTPGSGCSGSPHNGTATTPPIVIGDYGKVSLTFWSWWEIAARPLDQLTLNVSTNDGPFGAVAQLNPPAPVGLDNSAKPFTNVGLNTSPQWMQHKVSLNLFKNTSVRLQFKFKASGDSDGFRGWLIDDVMVECEP